MIERNPNCISCALHETLCRQTERDIEANALERERLAATRRHIFRTSRGIILAEMTEPGIDTTSLVADLEFIATTADLGEVVIEANEGIVTMVETALKTCEGPTPSMDCSLPACVREEEEFK